jgi:hypothetical protein
MGQGLQQHAVLDAHRLTLGAVDHDDGPSARAANGLELDGKREASTPAPAQSRPSELGQQWKRGGVAAPPDGGGQVSVLAQVILVRHAGRADAAQQAWQAHA